MKKRTALSFSLILAIALVLTSCYAKVVVLQEAPKESAPQTTASAVTVPQTSASVAKSSDNLKTGLSFNTNTTKSKDQSAQSETTLVAVAVDEEGRIQDCIIDMVQAKISFDDKGQLTSDTSALVQSKNELGDAYGMRKASSIGKEWNEQMAALSQYVIGKTASEVKGIATSEGKASDADLSSSVTLYIGSFVNAILEAVEKAEYRGAKTGDELRLVTYNTLSSSKAASADKNGNAQADITVAVVTVKGDVLTSCYIDAVQPKVAFDAKGKITSALEEDVRTKNELDKEYGMSKYSSLGADWKEQTAAYCEYVTGKTLSEIQGIAMNEKTAPSDADLSSSVTMSIGGFQSLLSKVR